MITKAFVFLLAFGTSFAAHAAPSVQIINKPAAVQTVNSATFSFSGTNVASYTCTLKSSNGSYAAIGACSSPRGYTSLPNGSYYFQVDATDSGGAKASAYYSFQVSVSAVTVVAAPTVKLVSVPASSINVNNASFSFSGTNVSSYTCTLKNSIGSYASIGACASPKVYSSLPNGNYYFQLDAVNSSGGKASAVYTSFQVNVSAVVVPKLSITSAPASSITVNNASFSFVGVNLTSYICTLKNSSGNVISTGACASPKSYANLANGTYSFQVDGSNANGAKVSASSSFKVAVVSTPTVPAPVISSFKASSSSINAGQAVTLSWSIANSTSISISGIGDVTGKTSISASPAATTVYIITAKNAGGSVTASASVNVIAAVPAPAISSFKASSSSINAGQAVTLSWSIANSTSISISGIGDVTGKTSVSVSPASTITYTITAKNAGGSATANASVTVVAVAVPVQTVAGLSNPVTKGITGSHMTYNVGPNQIYTEPDSVPWSELVAGDVVNIFYRSTPYKYKICLRGQGTKAAPIIVNGVTDASGNRPVFNFNGARTAIGCNSGAHAIFSSAPAHGESLGGIVIKAGVNDPYAAYKPQWITIKNLELYGASKGNTYTTLAGATEAYGTPGGIYVHLGRDILLENNVIYDNSFGIFTMAKGESLDFAVERITVRNSRVYSNGVSGSYYEHNFYVQSTNPVIEGNYIGQVRAGSQGSSYKSRSSGEIFRYNYVEASARAIDWVHSEEQANGIIKQADYGTDYAYGNIIVNDANLPRGGAYAAIHYGGDNLNEDGGLGVALVKPTTPYRSHLYFFNNTYVAKATSAQMWRVIIFDISLASITVDAWNNIFSLNGNANFSWVGFSGKLNLRGNNLLNGSPVVRDNADPAKIAISQLGTLITADVKFADLANSNYKLQSTSPAIDKATSVPAGLPANLATMTPMYQPQLKTNGSTARGLTGTALDLGAIEYSK